MTKEEIIEQIDLLISEIDRQKQEISELNGVFKSNSIRLKILKNSLKKIDFYSAADLDLNEIPKDIKNIKSYSKELQAVYEKENYQIGFYELNVLRRSLTLNGVKKRLTVKETQLLGLLAANLNELLVRSYMLNTIWNDNSYYAGRSMDVYLCKLRVLLKDDSRINIINYHGKGYKLFIM